MTRAFHGTGERAIQWLVEEYREFEHDAFLRMWHQGDAEAEWPEFYEWLDAQNDAPKDRAISMIRDLVIELETWEPEMLEVLQATPQAALMREWLGKPRLAA